MKPTVCCIALLVVICTGQVKDCREETVCFPKNISSVSFHKNLRCHAVTDYPGLVPSKYYTRFLSPCDIAKHQCWFDNKLTIKGPVDIKLCPSRKRKRSGNHHSESKKVSTGRVNADDPVNIAPCQVKVGTKNEQYENETSKMKNTEERRKKQQKETGEDIVEEKQKRRHFRQTVKRYARQLTACFSINGRTNPS